MPKNITSVEWQAQDIPSGLAFDQATGTFTGTPAGTGDFTVPVTVTTNYGTDTKDVLITIEENEQEWKSITTPFGIYINKCLDLGGELLFFGNGSNQYGPGIFFSYNPSTKKYSDALTLLSGEPVTSDTGDSNDRFLVCAIDPVSKKWIAIFGSYIRTPDGVKKFEDTSITFRYMTCCWSDTLQRFCAIGQVNNECISYIFDIDGNLLERSTYDNNGLSPAIIDSGSVAYGYQCKICWSNMFNKFFTILSTLTTTNNGKIWIAYSEDGLNWGKYILFNAALYPFFVTAIDDLNILLATFGSELGTSSGQSKTTYIYKSTDGLNWEFVRTIAGYTHADVLKFASWSQTKNILCMSGTHGFSFMTNDLIDYTEKTLPNYSNVVTAISVDGGLIWSDTMKSFIVTPGCHVYRQGVFYTLHI